MAAAARLAKAGHSVELFEARDRLGGGWAPYELDGVLIDDAPAVLNFPAPWRDLFRKSGRPLEAELARRKLALEPAPPPRYRFSDGSELVLPSERGEQYTALNHAYGPAVAGRWRDLLDGLELAWQAVRSLGLESELRDRRQLAAAAGALRHRVTIDELADSLGQAQLAALVRSVAYRLGSLPERTPAWCATELLVQRTFGRWAVAGGNGGPTTGRASVLVDALADRLALRKVQVHLGQRVTRIDSTRGRVHGVTLADGRSVPARAVVCTADPWETYTALVSTVSWRTRRAVRRWAPAAAPTVAHRFSSAASDGLTETWQLTARGVPSATTRRPAGSGSWQTVHDYGTSTPRRSAGIAWNGFGSWLARPPVRSEVDGLLLAGPAGPGGATPWAVVLSGALAAHACQGYLT